MIFHNNIIKSNSFCLPVTFLRLNRSSNLDEVRYREIGKGHTLLFVGKTNILAAEPRGKASMYIVLISVYKH